MYQHRIIPSRQWAGGFRPVALCVCLILLAAAGTGLAGSVSAAANVPPTLDAIPDITATVGGGDITVHLSGISAGAGDIDQTLSITATSSNTALIPDPAVTYTSPEAVGSLLISPIAGVTGTATITVTVKDSGGTLDGIDTTSRSFLVTINPANHAPIISPFTKTGVRGQPLAFSAGDFTSAYADFDSNPLVKVKFVALPGTGTLALSGTPVLTNAEIPASQLDLLTFTPLPGWYGSATFSWNGSDGLDYGAQPATITLDYPYTPLTVYLPLAMRPFVPWNTLLAENFEGNFPAGWQLDSIVDDNGTYYNATSYIAWAKRNCHAFSGGYGGWAVGGGSIGSNKPCTAGYPDNMLTFMTYGPINLSQVKDAMLTMKFWLDSEYQYDVLGIGASLDNNMFYGDTFSGNSHGWTSETLDLKNVYNLGNLTGRSQVWIGVWFSTDSVTPLFEEGAFVDDISVITCPSVGDCPGQTLTARASTLPDTLQEKQGTFTLRKP